MADTTVDFPTREQCVAAILESWAGLGDSPGTPLAELADDAVAGLIEGCHLMPADRYDQDCHACDLPIRDHSTDGRHPHELIADVVKFIVESLGACACWNDPESLTHSVYFGIPHDATACDCVCHKAAVPAQDSPS